MFSESIFSVRADQADTLISALVERIRQLEGEVSYQQRNIDGLTDTISKLRAEKQAILASIDQEMKRDE